MRSKRTNRRELKAEIDRLRLALEAAENKPPATTPAAEAEPAVEAAPKIAARGYPLRSEPQQPKSLKEAKEILMSLREW